MMGQVLILPVFFVAATGACRFGFGCFSDHAESWRRVAGDPGRTLMGGGGVERPCSFASMSPMGRAADAH